MDGWVGANNGSLRWLRWADSSSGLALGGIAMFNQLKATAVVQGTCSLWSALGGRWGKKACAAWLAGPVGPSAWRVRNGAGGRRGWGQDSAPLATSYEVHSSMEAVKLPTFPTSASNEPLPSSTTQPRRPRTLVCPSRAPSARRGPGQPDSSVYRLPKLWAATAPAPASDLHDTTTPTMTSLPQR